MSEVMENVKVVSEAIPVVQEACACVKQSTKKGYIIGGVVGLIAVGIGAFIGVRHAKKKKRVNPQSCPENDYFDDETVVTSEATETTEK